jgi:hypothetical protein
MALPVEQYADVIERFVRRSITSVFFVLSMVIAIR